MKRYVSKFEEASIRSIIKDLVSFYKTTNLISQIDETGIKKASFRIGQSIGQTIYDSLYTYYSGSSFYRKEIIDEIIDGFILGIGGRK